jgi:hypothetical protein
MFKTLGAAIAATILALPMLAADISGNWKATAEGPNGAIERTFTFKVDGTNVTGETVSQFMGKSEIKDGKLEGEKITFTIKGNFQGNEMTIKYEGKATDSSFKLTSTFQGGDIPPFEWTLTRAK